MSQAAVHRRAGRPPAGPAKRPGRTLRWRRWLVNLALAAAAIVSLLYEPVSIAIHSIVGLVFAGLVGPHLWQRRAWIRGTLRQLRRRRGLARRSRWSLLQGVVLLALTVVVMVTGIHDWLGLRSKIAWHAISSIVLIAVVARHAWTRRRWLRNPGRRHRAASPFGAGDPEQHAGRL